MAVPKKVRTLKVVNDGEYHQLARAVKGRCSFDYRPFGDFVDSLKHEAEFAYSFMARRPKSMPRGFTDDDLRQAWTKQEGENPWKFGARNFVQGVLGTMYMGLVTVAHTIHDAGRALFVRPFVDAGSDWGQTSQNSTALVDDYSFIGKNLGPVYLKRDFKTGELRFRTVEGYSNTFLEATLHRRDYFEKMLGNSGSMCRDIAGRVCGDEAGLYKAVAKEVHVRLKGGDDCARVILEVTAKMRERFLRVNWPEDSSDPELRAAAIKNFEAIIARVVQDRVLNYLTNNPSTPPTEHQKAYLAAHKTTVREFETEQQALFAARCDGYALQICHKTQGALALLARHEDDDDDFELSDSQKREVVDAIYTFKELDRANFRLISSDMRAAVESVRDALHEEVLNYHCNSYIRFVDELEGPKSRRLSSKEQEEAFRAHREDLIEELDDKITLTAAEAKIDKQLARDYARLEDNLASAHHSVSLEPAMAQVLALRIHLRMRHDGAEDVLRAHVEDNPHLSASADSIASATKRLYSPDPTLSPPLRGKKVARTMPMKIGGLDVSNPYALTPQRAAREPDPGAIMLATVASRIAATLWKFTGARIKEWLRPALSGEGALGSARAGIRIAIRGIRKLPEQQSSIPTGTTTVKARSKSEADLDRSATVELTERAKVVQGSSSAAVTSMRQRAGYEPDERTDRAHDNQADSKRRMSI